MQRFRVSGVEKPLARWSIVNERLFHLLSHTELMRLHVWSGLQVMVPLPLTS